MSMSRLIVLGAVRMFQPIHGYDLRRELETWNVEEWANLSYGSIYFNLKTLAELHLLEEVGTDQVGNRPARTTYQITAAGEAEFQALLRTFWWQEQKAIDPFSAALAFMPVLPREELIAALQHRAQVLRSGAQGMEFTARVTLDDARAPHVAEVFWLMAARLKAEAAWADEAVDRLQKRERPWDTDTSGARR
jgi:DNA-binding PadR family transcriptional regulator